MTRSVTGPGAPRNCPYPVLGEDRGLDRSVRKARGAAAGRPEATGSQGDRGRAVAPQALRDAEQRTLQAVRVCLNRAVKRAMARDRVKRNVVELTEAPRGVAGRPCKALTAQQA